MNRYVVALGAVALGSLTLISACAGQSTGGTTASPSPTATSAAPSAVATATTQPDKASPSPTEGGLGTPIPGGGGMTAGSKDNLDAARAMPDVKAAIADLAAKQKVADDEVTILSFDNVEWRSGAMGCPEPGRMYTMALVEGRLLVLSAKGVKYNYHGGKDGGLAYCAKPDAPARTLTNK